MPKQTSKSKSAAVRLGSGDDDRQLVEQLAAIFFTEDTGYRAMATLVSRQSAITPFHVIQQAGLLEKNITKGFLQYQSQRQVIPVTVAEIDESADLALLRLERPVPFSVPIQDGELAGQPGSKWTSAVAYPKLDLAFLRGTFAGSATINGQPHLRLRVETRREDIPLQGISGGPVAIAGQFAGIMALGNSSQEELYAIPLSRILASKLGPELRDLVRGAPDVPSREDSNPFTGFSSAARETAVGEAPSSARSETAPWLTAKDIERFSEDVRGVLARAKQISENYSKRINHIEHLLLAFAERTGSPFISLLTERKIDLPKLLEPGLGPTPEAQESTEGEVPEFEGIPAVSANVRRAIHAAIAQATAEGQQTMELAHLLFGVLSTTRNPQVAELNRLGIAPSRVTLPSAAPVDRKTFLAGYNSDEAAGTDLLKIDEEVNALASVLAAKDVEPPLSLGLFGEWGTGKSFFMKMLETRIDELSEDAKKAETEGADKQSAYCSNVRQITFNAWNYIDADLWASLAAEIFENLAMAIAEERKAKDSPEERALVLAAASSSQSVLDVAEQKKRDAEAELKRTEERLANLQRSKGDIEAELGRGQLFRQLLGFAMEDPAVKTSIGKVKESLGIPEASAAAAKLQSEVLELEGTWSAIYFALKNEKRLWVWISAPVVALLAIWCTSKLLAKIDITGLKNEVFALLAGIGGLLAPLLTASQKVLKAVKTAQGRRNELMEEKRKDRERQLQDELHAVQDKVKTAHGNVTAAQEKVHQLNEQLDKMRADRRMADFVLARHQSTDYTQRLGTISRVRNDLKYLSTLLREVKFENQESEKLRKAKADKDKELERELKERQEKADKKREQQGLKKLFPRIDRIVLYIDDLDRCPEDTVVKVLQAVHLLLAFPLFVVVVGVDPRWLLYSLKQSSGAFRNQERADGEAPATDGESESHWHSTPLNYLEKIFQIPFTLRPIRKQGFGSMVDKYARPLRRRLGETTPDRDRQGEGAQEAAATAAIAGSGQSANEATGATTVSGTTPSSTTGIGPTLGATSGATVSGAPAGVPEQKADTNAASAGHGTAQEDDAGTVDEPVIDRMPEYLNISGDECTFMKELHRFIPSPRAGKRFINIYRLLRASVKEGERGAFAGNAKGGPYQTAMALLGVLTAHPNQATEIFRDLIEGKPEGTWREFRTRYEAEVLAPEPIETDGSTEKTTRPPEGSSKKSSSQLAKASERGRKRDTETEEPEEAPSQQPEKRTDRAEWMELFEKLRGIEEKIGARPMMEFVRWAPRVARYSFQSGRVLYYEQE